MTNAPATPYDVPLTEFKQRLDAARGTHPDPEALAEMDRIATALLEENPNATYLDFMIIAIGPESLFETLLDMSDECQECLKATYEGRDKTCGHPPHNSENERVASVLRSK